MKYMLKITPEKSLFFTAETIIRSLIKLKCISYVDHNKIFKKIFYYLC